MDKDDKDVILQFRGCTIKERNHENYEPTGVPWFDRPKPPYNVAAIIDEDELLLVRQQKQHVEAITSRKRYLRTKNRVVKMLLNK
jgi:hypothetical protein